MDYLDRITIESGKRSGKPCIRGMRITVARRARKRRWSASSQSLGALELRTTVDSLVRLTVLGGSGEEALSVSTRGVGIVNQRESSAVYAVQIPLTVDSILVGVGGRVLYRLGTDGLATGTLRLALDSANTSSPDG